MLHAADVRRREAALAAAYVAIARRHNDAGLTAPVDPSRRDYYRRPARVLMAERFSEACLRTVNDPALAALPPLGAVDQVVDNTDVLASPRRFRRLANLYVAD